MSRGAWTIITVCLSFVAGMKFCDLMNYEIDKNRRGTIEALKSQVESKEALLTMRQNNVHNCVDSLISCEQSMLYYLRWTFVENEPGQCAEILP